MPPRKAHPLPRATPQAPARKATKRARQQPPESDDEDDADFVPKSLEPPRAKRQQITKAVGRSAQPSSPKVAVVEHNKQTAKPKSNGRAVKPASSKPQVIVIKPEYGSKQIFNRTGHFPRYDDPASVYIYVVKHRNYGYVFDKSTLARSSEWFAKALQEPCDEPDLMIAKDIKAKTGYEFRFELIECEGSPGWILRRSSLTEEKMVLNTGKSTPVAPEPYRIQQLDGSGDLLSDAETRSSKHRAETFPNTHCSFDVLPLGASLEPVLAPMSSDTSATMNIDQDQPSQEVKHEFEVKKEVFEESPRADVYYSQLSPNLHHINTMQKEEHDGSTAIEIDQSQTDPIIDDTARIKKGQSEEGPVPAQDAYQVHPHPAGKVNDIIQNGEHYGSIGLDNNQPKSNPVAKDFDGINWEPNEDVTIPDSTSASQDQATGITQSSPSVAKEVSAAIEGALESRLSPKLVVDKDECLSLADFPPLKDVPEPQRSSCPAIVGYSPVTNNVDDGRLMRDEEIVAPFAIPTGEGPSRMTQLFQSPLPTTKAEDAIKQEQHDTIPVATETSPNEVDAVKVVEIPHLPQVPDSIKVSPSETRTVDAIETPQPTSAPYNRTNETVQLPQYIRPHQSSQSAPCLKPSEIENSQQEKVPEVVSTTAGGIPLRVCEAYNNLFLLMHNLPANLDATDIHNAARQAELLLDTAHLYQCIHIVRPYIRQHLLSFGKVLFHAIVEDPPSWLAISSSLECPSIFKEAMIHLVGQAPKWQHQKSLYPEEIQTLIERKVLELSALKATVNEELLKSTINVDGQDLTLFNIDTSTYDSWYVVQIWRDWFCHGISAISNEKYKIGKLYRLMASEAYLPSVKVYQKLMNYKGVEIFAVRGLEEVEHDMSLLKRFAQKMAKQLVVNNSMLDVEQAGIEHLTCTNIDDTDLPWVKNAGE